MYKIEAVKKEINSILVTNIQYKKVMLQFPDGLLDKFILEIVLFLKEKGISSIIAGDPSYGACDLPVHQSLYFNFDVNAIFHFGHSTFAFPKPDIEIDVYYFIVEADIEIDWNLINEELSKYTWKKIGILTTIQHTNILNQAGIHLGKDYSIVVHKEGQILGCNQDRAKKIANDVDAFLVIAGGDFHASPVVIATGKETLRFDPFNKGFYLFDNEYRNKYLKKRYASIIKAKKAKVWGVLLSLKSGQFPKDAGARIVKILEDAGKIVMIIPMFRIDPNHLINFGDVDAWVISLCPRIATDDFVSFNKPILTARELLVALNLMTWENFVNDKSKEQLLTIEEL